MHYTLLIARLISAQDSKSKDILNEIDGSGLESMKFDNAWNYAMELSLKVVSRGMPRQQQLYYIRRFSYLPYYSAQFARYAGRTGTQMLRIYEHSRAIIWDRLLNRKTQIELLY